MTKAVGDQPLAAPYGHATGADRARLRRYLIANTWNCSLLSLALVAMRFTLVRSNWVLIDALGVGAAAGALAACVGLLNRDRIGAVIATMAVSNWLVSLQTVTVTPFILPPIVLSVLLPVAATVPMLDRRHLVAVSAGAIATAAAACALAQLRLVVGVEEQAPDWLKHLIVAVSVPMVTAFILYNVWRAHLGLIRQTSDLQESRARIVGATDAARRAFERDLHDGAQQRLAAVAIQLGMARQLVAQQPARAVELIGGLDHELSEAIAELRDLAHGIYPPLLGQRGLGEALRAAARRVPVPVAVQCEGIGRYPTEVETAVYFSCLEALHNAVKHGQPGSIEVRLTAVARRLRFEVSDDGVGFDTTFAGLHGRSGAGLVNVADRLGAVGGEMRVRSTPTRGTTVTGTIPAEPLR